MNTVWFTLLWEKALATREENVCAKLVSRDSTEPRRVE